MGPIRGMALAPALNLGPRADGTVTAVNGNTVTIKSDGNQGPNPSSEYDSVATITLGSNTKYLAGPGQTADASSIKVGSFIVVKGTLSSDKTSLAATTVMLGGPHGHGGFGTMNLGPRADGTVTAVNESTVTITPDANHGPGPSNQSRSVTTIVLNGSTKYQAGWGQTASASSVKVGSHIVANGTLSSDKTTLTATTIMVLPNSPAGGFPVWDGSHGPGPASFGNPWR
jgi:primosomal replication protein N